MDFVRSLVLFASDFFLWFVSIACAIALICLCFSWIRGLLGKD